MTKMPLSALLLSLLGVLCLIPAVVSLMGFGGVIHPVLADPLAGLAFLVSAIALLGSAGFPLVIRRLMARDIAAAGSPEAPETARRNAP